MKQLSFWDVPTSNAVNPASVKHRSPFRYPGGKTWLVPQVRQWLTQQHPNTVHFIEPFAGGAIVGLTVAFEQLAQHVTLVELDAQVAAVWQTILDSEHGEWLADEILGFNLTAEDIDMLLGHSPPSTRDLALQTIIKNRVNHGGILAKGAGRLKHGENGRGLQSRWYPKTLARRIRDIISIKESLSFIHGDGLQVIDENRQQADTLFFIDPPYTASSKKPGRRLYDHSDIDHEMLFKLLAEAEADFLMTYDNVPEIKEHAKRHNFDFMAIPMKNTHHVKLTELLIGRNLAWART